MTNGESHGLGYDQVDDDPNVAVLLSTMDTTARWQATAQLRAWERDRLNLHGAQRLLDVGCGLGEASRVLAEDLGSEGELVGVDASTQMLVAARAGALDAACVTRFVRGDALALGLRSSSFDAVRSERTLQWVPDPQRAVAELARVLRPGGRMCLIDTDWSTFHLETGDPTVAQVVVTAMAEEHRRPSNVGRRLADLVYGAGLSVAATNSATQHWSEWDPDASPAPGGCFSMSSLAEDLVDRGQLEPEAMHEFVTGVSEAARAGQFSMSLTMHAVFAKS